jgi:membrane-bound lytic murein transglycosylase B
MRGLRRVVVATGLVLASLLVTGSPAHARGAVEARSTAPQAEDAAQAAQAKVDALIERYQEASAGVNSGVRALSDAFAAADAAEGDRGRTAGQERRARARRAADIRAVYATGGPLNLAASVLGASTPGDALWRASTANRVFATLLAQDTSSAAARAGDLRLARARAQAADAATAAQARALDQLQARAARAGAALQQAEQTLADLDARARRARAAQEAIRQLAAARAAEADARSAAMGTVTALGIPAEYESAYQGAARTCPGMDWTLLAAVGQVESGHGRNVGPSSAGAIGPMQFLPATFAGYAVDGDGDGVLDAWDPQDAIWTAAHYLCVSGADGGSAAGIHAALLAYNHAEWYVDLVLAAQQAIIEQQATLSSP